ncbi:hypothetical protein RM549_13545 [Salegentibacter sp. F188]|uniref:Uncharacterized protein n=1 Tax=Autumnicola patrickiae TaxID=3075591 RepID=A0ABU3E494_9FLAO|nr:hypothetical protein [Salegentibacter sp. F188]MDT0690816.1 hypothetical protein [Salegentibacter sp. F188]
MFLKYVKPLLMVVLLAAVFSCSEDESPSGTETPDEVEDTFYYIALRNDGTLFNIGNNSGKVVQTGRIPGIEFNTLFNSVTSSDSETFIYEHRFDPPRGILHEKNSESGQIQSTILDFPEQFGENTALLSLDWEEENQDLIGITRENMEQSNHQRPIMVVRINPDNLQIISQDINLATEGYENVFSTSLVGQKLYVVASKTERVVNADLLEIDLEQNSITILPFSETEAGITNLGNSGSPNSLFGFVPVANSSIMAEVRPVIYDIQAKTSSEISEVPQISALHFAHKTFYNKEGGEFAELVGANNAKSIFKYYPSTGDHQIIKLQNADDLSSLINIIGIREL